MVGGQRARSRGHKELGSAESVISVTTLPHTRTGKRLKLPVKRLIQGHALEKVASRDAVDDYDTLAQFAAFRRGSVAGG